MILVLGGTRDALLLAQRLYRLDGIVYSAATEYGSSRAEDLPGKVIYGKKNIKELCHLIKENAINIVVDGSHPYAANTSLNAIKACEEMGIEYIRYERPSLIAHQKNIMGFQSFEEAAAYGDRLEGKIFITTGTKDMETILSKIRDKSRVVVRVLPWSDSIIALEKLGLNPDNIIAMKGPFSEEMNYLMLKETGARIMLTKDSGTAGGMEEKLRAAEQLGIKVLMVKRPEINYPNKYNTMEGIFNVILKKD